MYTFFDIIVILTKNFSKYMAYLKDVYSILAQLSAPPACRIDMDIQGSLNSLITILFFNLLPLTFSLYSLSAHGVFRLAIEPHVLIILSIKDAITSSPKWQNTLPEAKNKIL